MYGSLNYMNYMNISEFPWKSHPFIINHVFQDAHNHNKAIIDGQYLAPPHASDCNVHPIKIENGTFDDMTHFLMSWPTSWRKCVSYVMMNVLLSWSILDFMNSFSGTKYHEKVFLKL